MNDVQKFKSRDYTLKQWDYCTLLVLEQRDNVKLRGENAGDRGHHNKHKLESDDGLKIEI